MYSFSEGNISYFVHTIAGTAKNHINAKPKLILPILYYSHSFFYTQGTKYELFYYFESNNLVLPQQA